MARALLRRKAPLGREGLDFLPAAALLAFSLLAVGAAALAPGPEADAFAVVAPPWYGLDRTAGLVAAAGGQLVNTGGLANVVIAYSGERGFPEALYKAGALLVLNPARLRGCLGFGRGPGRSAGA
jgi:hypothetical protein